MSDCPDAWSGWLGDGLGDLATRSQDRTLRPLVPTDGLHGRLGDQDVVLFSGNDYLALSDHPAVRDAASRAALHVGLGPRGSPLVCGYTDAHEALEDELAVLAGTQSALLFPTGFAANLAVLASLADEDTAIFSDALNHASIIDGCRLARLSGASVSVYAHRNMAELEAQLTACQRPRRLLVTDGVFSMDGDVAPLAELARLKARHGALLAVDEAHASLVFGPTGGGAAEALGVSHAVDLHVGTLSKAFGAQGGFIATSHTLRRWLLHKGRSFVYSTALPVPVVAAARAALAVANGDPGRRERLWSHVERVTAALGRPPTSPICIQTLGTESAALEASDRLLERGLHVVAIRPPTVPEGTSRLRITLSAGHTDDEVSRLIEALTDLAPG